MHASGSCHMQQGKIAVYNTLGLMNTLTLLIVACLLSGCGDLYRFAKSGPVGWEIKKQLRDRGLQTIDLSEVAPFGWSELFLFNPYSSRDSVCKRLSIGPSQCTSVLTSESVDEGFVLLVFRNSDVVVHSELHFRFHGDFAPVPTSQPIARAAASFRAVAERQSSGSEPWLKLQLAEP